MEKLCVIDLIVEKTAPAAIVYEDDVFIAFLDIHPVFLGHTLLSPKGHYETLYDLPEALVASFFMLAQRLGKAVELAMDAEGTFIGMNNTVSQSIPHLHLHIVPRNKKDGLKGFFWPRHHYASTEAMEAIQLRIKEQLKELIITQVALD